MKRNSLLSFVISSSRVLLTAGMLLILPAVLWASNDPPPRVSYLDGTAAYESAGQVDWSEVAVNLPLLSGDRVFSHDASRVEIEIGNGSFLRLAENTDVVFLQAVGKEITLALVVGEMVLRVNDSSDFVVRLPNATVEIQKKGLYRISVDERSGQTRVIVRKGRADVAAQSEKQRVKEGQELVLNSSAGPLSQIVAASFPDDFDLWSDRRDARYLQSASLGYVGGYAHGVYDLDIYGSWSNLSGYGWAWFPRVSIGWVPYRSGWWLRYPSWGWTWVSYEPWGWLPYHYGRWVYHQPYSRWCWVPGVSFSFSFWSPSLVDFYYGGGYVGWAPRGHGRGHTTIVHDNSVTVVNNTVINNWGRGSRGMTVVREGDFAGRDARRTRVENPSREMVDSMRPGLPAQEVSWASSERRRGGGGAIASSRATRSDSSDVSVGESGSSRGRSRSSSWLFGRGNAGSAAASSQVPVETANSLRERNENRSGENAASPGAVTGRNRETVRTESANQNRNWNRLPSGVAESRSSRERNENSEQERTRWQRLWNESGSPGVSRSGSADRSGASEVSATRGTSRSGVRQANPRTSSGASSIEPRQSQSQGTERLRSWRSTNSRSTIGGNSRSSRSSGSSAFSAPRAAQPSGSTIRSRPSSVPSSRPSVRPSVPSSRPSVRPSSPASRPSVRPSPPRSSSPASSSSRPRSSNSGSRPRKPEK